jgi:hypothetical protein
MEFWRWVRCQWDRAAAFVAFVAGLVSLLLGWIGISGSSLPSEQIPYLASDTVFGLFALGTAATLWLSADLRDDWRKLDDMHATMLERGTHETGYEFRHLAPDPNRQEAPEPELNGLHAASGRRAGR